MKSIVHRKTSATDEADPLPVGEEPPGRDALSYREMLAIATSPLLIVDPFVHAGAGVVLAGAPNFGKSWFGGRPDPSRGERYALV